MEDRQHLLRNLRRFTTLGELRRSEFFLNCRRELDSLLAEPQAFPCQGAAPRVRGFLRVVAWNIEKGKRLHETLHLLKDDPVLKLADVVLLNEVDRGMNRSANADVGRVLACALGMNLVYAPAHLELTKGTGDELALPGENTDSLQGNAVLSRYPVVETRVVRLPDCFEPFEFHEKRYGSRNGLWVRIAAPGPPLWLCSVHLEVRNSPACRARQMRHLVGHLPGGAGARHLIGGDLNTSGFARGSRWRTMRAACRLVSQSPDRMRRILCHPEAGAEPLFRAAKRAGFAWEGLNSFDETACTPIEGLEDAAFLPAAAVRAINRRLAPYNGELRFKLDWFLGRGIEPLRRGDAFDEDARSGSLDPGCIKTGIAGADRISDHRPIHVDIRIP